MMEPDWNDNQIASHLEAGAAIRPVLEQLLGEKAGAVDGQLGRLLNGITDRRRAAIAVKVLLEAEPSTKRWLAAHLAYRLNGQPTPVGAQKYACPRGDYIWFRPNVGAAIPQCTTHHLTLQPSP